MGTFGPNVSLKWSLGRVNVEMISATPPTRALLKLNVSKAVHRSLVSIAISVRGPRRYKSILPFWTRATARWYKDCHRALISVLRLRCAGWISIQACGDLPFLAPCSVGELPPVPCVLAFWPCSRTWWSLVSVNTQSSRYRVFLDNVIGIRIFVLRNLKEHHAGGCG